MTKSEIQALNTMRTNGKPASEIAIALRISANTVRSYIKRHPRQSSGDCACRYCGSGIVQTKGRKIKLFCSDRCRNAWWKEHPEKINKKAYYTLPCEYCGKEFTSYGNKNRKYCSRACYADSRKGNSIPDAAGPVGRPL